MAVTLGLMFRVDSFPPAVVTPPQTQPAQFNNNLVIDAQSVKEPAMSAAAGDMFRGMPKRTAVDAEIVRQQQQQPLTYNQRGGSQLPVVGGQLLDTYA